MRISSPALGGQILKELSKVNTSFPNGLNLIVPWLLKLAFTSNFQGSKATSETSQACYLLVLMIFSNSR